MKRNLKLFWLIIDITHQSQQHYTILSQQFPYNSLTLIENYLKSQEQIEFITESVSIRISLTNCMAQKWRIRLYSDLVHGNELEFNLKSSKQQKFYISNLSNVLQAAQNKKQMIDNYFLMTTHSKFNLIKSIQQVDTTVKTILDEYLVVLSLNQQKVQDRSTYQEWKMWSDSREREIQLQFNSTNFIITIRCLEHSMKAQGKNGKIIRVEQLLKDNTVKAIRDYQTNQLWSANIAGQLDDDLKPQGYVCSNQFDGFSKNNQQKQGVIYYQDDLGIQKFVYGNIKKDVKQCLVPNYSQWISYQPNISQGVRYHYTQDDLIYFGDLEGNHPTLHPKGQGVIITKEGVIKQVQAIQNQQYTIIQSNQITIQFIQIGKQINPNNKVMIPLIQTMDHIAFPFNCFEYKINSSTIELQSIQQIINLIEQKSKNNKYLAVSIGDTTFNVQQLLSAINSKLLGLDNLFISLQNQMVQTSIYPKRYKHQLYYINPLEYLFKSQYMQIKIKLNKQGQNGLKLEGEMKDKKILGNIGTNWEVDKDSVLITVNKT